MTIPELQKEIIQLKERLDKCNAAYKEVKAKLDDIEAQESEGDIDIVIETYPRKTSRKSAIKAIHKSIRALKKKKFKDPISYLTDRTMAYAICLRRFGITTKHEKWNLVPHASTWYNQERYYLDESEWSSPFREGKYVEEKKAQEVPEEPDGWREALVAIFPGADPSRYTWEYFANNYKEELNEVWNYLSQNKTPIAD